MYIKKKPATTLSVNILYVLCQAVYWVFYVQYYSALNSPSKKEFIDIDRE